MTNTTESRPRLHYKRPRRGMALDLATGPETVLDVRKGGLEITTQDRIGRTWDRERADDGWWIAVYEPCDVCRRPTHARYWLSARNAYVPSEGEYRPGCFDGDDNCKTPED